MEGGERSIPAGAARAWPPDGTLAAGGAVEPFLGGDGLATLLLACVVALATAGISLAVAFGHVLRVARAAPVQALPAAGAPRRVLVLGRRLRRDGTPCAVFRARLDRAAALAARDPSLAVVLLGGATRPGLPAEAEAGRRHLLAAGLAPARLATEARSRHTLENLRHFRAVWGAAPAPPDLLITSRHHLARALMMARGLGLAVAPCAAEARFRATPATLARLAREAFLVHWYVVGRGFARLVNHRGMLARIG
ncbi:YdcF family protein [Caldovatus aquaticus]|uniref:YdcF family protein n=1 Tax=Caldovatus aquaticus TaxID=2865671 RepID=A0ABS7F144_9PROT|nr:YdcF family protein [Caldovatus aquaticus]MBW8269209.1 YdcF family protein [Caldovatus aquaticus]